MQFLPRNSHKFMGHWYLTKSRLLELDKIFAESMADFKKEPKEIEKRIVLTLKDKHQVEVESFEEAMSDSRMDSHTVTGFEVNIKTGRARFTVELNSQYPAWVYINTSEPDNKLMKYLSGKCCLWAKEIKGHNLVLALRVVCLFLMLSLLITFCYFAVVAKILLPSPFFVLFLLVTYTAALMPISWFDIGKGKKLMPVITRLPKFIGFTLPMFLAAPWLDALRKWIVGSP